MVCDLGGEVGAMFPQIQDGVFLVAGQEGEAAEVSRWSLSVEYEAAERAVEEVEEVEEIRLRWPARRP